MLDTSEALAPYPRPRPLRQDLQIKARCRTMAEGGPRTGKALVLLRRTPLAAHLKGNTNRKADGTTNAVLNYLLKLAEIEARLACIAVRLDPGFGVLHLGAIRRQVERFTLDGSGFRPVRTFLDGWAVLRQFRGPRKSTNSEMSRPTIDP